MRREEQSAQRWGVAPQFPESLNGQGSGAQVGKPEAHGLLSFQGLNGLH